MQSEITELTNEIRNHIKDSAARDLANEKRNTRTETLLENFATNVDKLTVTVGKAIESNTKLEAKVASLEEDAINKLNLVEDTVNENTSKLDIIDKRVGIIEVLNAERAGREAGVKEAMEEFEKKSTTNWTRVLTILGLVITAIGVAYTLLSKSTGTG